MSRKRGPVVIAENLDFWHSAYVAIIGLLFLGYTPAAQLATRYVDYNTAFAGLVTPYLYSLAVWAGIFTIAGGYLDLGFYALLAIMGPGYLVYLLNPAATALFSSYPFGYREKLEILRRFREFPELASARFSFLLAEVHNDVETVLGRGFPHLAVKGLDDLFVDVQLAMRVGNDVSKETVWEFFNVLTNINFRIGNAGTTYSAETLETVHRFSVALVSSDEIRRRNVIEGVWRNGLIDWIGPYRDWILVGLTAMLVILTLLLIVAR